jgi:hypothetical protein
MMPSGRAFLAALAVFGLSVAGLVAWDARSWAPPQVYRRYQLDERDPFLAVTADRPVTVELPAGDGAPTGLYFAAFAGEGERELSVRVREAGSGALLGEGVERGRGLARHLAFARQPAPGERLVLEFRSRAAVRGRAPARGWGLHGPGPAVRVVLGVPDTPGVEIVSPFRGPLFLLEHPPGAAARLWWLAWLPALALAAWCARRPRLGPALLVVLGLAASAASLALWRAHIAINGAHLAPDGYGDFARALARWVQEPDARPELRAYFHGYPHAQTGLASLLLAAAILCGAPWLEGYAVLSALASFAALCLFVRLCRSRLGLSPLALALSALLFTAHLSTLRAFARPLTDSLGLLLVVWSLDLLLARLERRSRAQDLALALLVLLHLLARPQGPALVAFLGAGVLLADLQRDGLRPRAMAATVLVGFALPGLCVLGAYAAFDWFHNADLLLRMAQEYVRGSTWKNLRWALPATFQALPLLWLLAGRRLREPRALLLLAWCALYVAMLAAVRAPFWTRHFLPVVPAAVALAGLGLERAAPRLRRPAAALALLLAAANLVFLWRLLGTFPDVPWPRLLD